MAELLLISTSAEAFENGKMWKKVVGWSLLEKEGNITKMKENINYGQEVKGGEFEGENRFISISSKTKSPMEKC